MSVDWVGWHQDYADPGSPLSRRLLVVQEQIRRALPARRPSERFKVISLCAGQGEDLIGVLAKYPHREHVWVRMVELDGVNVAAMRARARAVGVQLDIVQADAAQSSLYGDIAPADLVLVCGVFGNISPEDVGFTIRSLPQLCRTGATVIWTRSRRPPDLTPQIRRWFAGSRFEEIAFVAPDGVLFCVGSSRFLGVPQPVGRDRLFSFRR